MRVKVALCLRVIFLEFLNMAKILIALMSGLENHLMLIK